MSIICYVSEFMTSELFIIGLWFVIHVKINAVFYLLWVRIGQADLDWIKAICSLRISFDFKGIFKWMKTQIYLTTKSPYE